MLSKREMSQLSNVGSICTNHICFKGFIATGLLYPSSDPLIKPVHLKAIRWS